ncbi:hypothetical protein Tco_0487266 [Tanacetum coccineum]
MSTEMELTLEQTQQGVSYEVSNIRVILSTMKMEILLEPTSNKLMVEHAEFDESNANVLERFYTSVGNHVNEILLKLNLPDHRSILTDSKVTLTKHGRMTKPYSSPLFIDNCVNAGYLKMVVKSIKVKEFQRSFRHSDIERLSRSDEVLKLKNFKKDATLKLSKSTNQEWYENVGPEVTRSQDDKVTRWQNEIMLG